jgi:hypothetical protein
MSSITLETKLFWRRLEIVLGVVSLVLWIGWYWLWMRYSQTRPPSPDPVTGRIYLLDTHGSLVYLISTERFRLYLLQGSAALSFIAAALLDIAKHPFRK